MQRPPLDVVAEVAGKLLVEVGLRKKITKASVDALLAGSGWLWDTEIKGFGVRRQFKSAVYSLKTSINGRNRWLTIGKHGSPWTAESARREAIRLLGSIHAGSDPATVRDLRRREPTIGQVLDRYLREHVEVRNRGSTLREVRRHIAKDIKPALGNIRISALTRADVVNWHNQFAASPYGGNRALAYLRKALSLASRDWGLRPDNPALGIAMFHETKRERFFSNVELGRIGAAIDDLEENNGALPGAIRAVRLLALTGMRLGEVLALRWDWLDWDAGCVRLPDQKAKAGARSVPLGSPALDYTASLERLGLYVCFGSAADSPLSAGGFYRFWYQLREKAKLSDARPHDFRHTVGTVSAQTGANAFQVRDLLGHRTLAMTGRYVERNIDPLKLTADHVAKRIASALSGQKLA
jgi:integrase